LHDVPHLALLGAIQKRSVPSNCVPVRHRDIEDGGNAVQRSLPGLFVGEITFDQFDAKLPELLGTGDCERERKLFDSRRSIAGEPRRRQRLRL
jgi:hypothetical protein